MPLIQGHSKEAFQKNLKAEIGAGKPMKQSLAIAYAVKRKNKKAHGGMISSDENLKKAADYELNKEGQASQEAVKVHPGEMPPKKDMAREMDPVVSQHSEANEMLHPSMEPEHSAESLNMRSGIQTLPEHELDHDEIIPHAEQEDGLYGHDVPDSENLPEHMMAHGGMMEPKHMAVMIMKKRAHGGMAYSEGGLVNDGDEELHGDEHQIVSIDRMPSNPYNEIEGAGEMREQMKRRAMLQGIMAGLHSSHMRGMLK